MIKKFAVFLFLNCILLTGCGNPMNDSLSLTDTTFISQTQVPASAKAGTRDNTPVVLVPKADGVVLYGNSLVSLDASHTKDGYLMVQYLGSSQKVKMQLTTPENITYTYTLHDGFETFPLTGNTGSYRVTVFELIHDNQYTTAFSQDIDVSSLDEFSPYLYPNQYVNFTATDETVKMGEDLAGGADTDLDVVTNVYNYVIHNITYDKEKAANVESGYLPEVDEILRSGTGICFDYAALMAAMLRSQRIPARLEVGYAKDAYHAWISVYIKDVGWVNGIIEFDGTSWELMDPTFAAGKSEKKLKSFIGDGSNYQTKFIY